MPEIVDKEDWEIKHIISLIKNSSLPDEVKPFVTKCIELAVWLPLFLKNKNISLRRLRTLIFGKGYSGGKKNSSKQKKLTTQANLDSTSPFTPSTVENITSNSIIITTEELSTNVNLKIPKPGHGRMAHAVYNNHVEIKLLQQLTAGDDCPSLCGGKLSDYKAGVIVRIKGQNFAQIYKYVITKLRCNLCGIVIKAETPPNIGTEKYDESFKAMLALMKYYMAIPFYRQENFQRTLDFPLSDATQWGLIESLASYCYATFNQLKQYAANAPMLQNDDTTLRILEIIKQIKAGDIKDRTGMYTTSIIANYDGHQIALFMNGRQHSGENVAEILKLRASDKKPIIQMCDALSANIPKTMQTILCNCLSHGFRKFEELVDFFDIECLNIMTKLSKVFENDASTRNMPPQERLKFHQQHSKPIMDELKQYMETLIAEHRVEPNSELGKAIKYMQRHWEKLTRFLTVAGAPIDNNIVERALKVAIRNRKSSMFYRTVYSAGIGGMLTSLIYTCHLANQNPHKYLIALQIHQTKVLANPEQWLPWNYLETMANYQATDANQQVHLPLLDCLAVA